ncbi:WecB/TagA/CpsF family glycosyltransferase [Ramlibacter sp. MAHUQ-53]|uniref:WecB/TagA/CpsF family glycosyltransferase n=1 Tax=unclassified Ramlibacter TaxID=2617605 RepID=UPI00363A9B42
MSEPPWHGRWLRLVRALSVVHGEAGCGQLLEWLDRPAGPHVLAFANAHALNLAARDAAFARDLLVADTLLRDGVGVGLFMALANRAPGLNLNGTDLIPRLLRRHAGASIALLGTREPWLSRARAVVEGEWAPGARCVVAHGFLPVNDYVRLVREHRPRLVVLAMGMPRQEAVARALRDALRHPCLVVCGGAILDFLAGRTVRAPRPLRAAGLEWAWRLACEPRRLFGRYVVGNPVFLARALGCAWRDWRGAGGQVLH